MSMYSVQICHQVWLLSLHLWDLSLQGSHLGSASTCLVACFDLQCLASFVVFFIWKGHAFEKRCFSCTACNIFTLLTYSIMQAIINTVINRVLKGYRLFNCGLKTATVYLNAFPWFGREAESSGKSETDILVSDISVCTCTCGSTLFISMSGCLTKELQTFFAHLQGASLMKHCCNSDGQSCALFDVMTRHLLLQLSHLSVKFGNGHYMHGNIFE